MRWGGDKMRYEMALTSQHQHLPWEQILDKSFGRHESLLNVLALLLYIWQGHIAHIPDTDTLTRSIRVYFIHYIYQVSGFFFICFQNYDLVVEVRPTRFLLRNKICWNISKYIWQNIYLICSENIFSVLVCQGWVLPSGYRLKLLAESAPIMFK